MDTRQQFAVPLRADGVKAGDLVVGYLDNGQRFFHADPYRADPRPDTAGCGCYGHSALTPADLAGPLVVLTDGEPWGVCDVVPADSIVLIDPA